MSEFYVEKIKKIRSEFKDDIQGADKVLGQYIIPNLKTHKHVR